MKIEKMLEEVAKWANDQANDVNRFPLARPRYEKLAKEAQLTLDMISSFISVDDAVAAQDEPLDEVENMRVKKNGIESILPQWMTD